MGVVEIERIVERCLENHGFRMPAEDSSLRGAEFRRAVWAQMVLLVMLKVRRIKRMMG
jgi:hypothetical protein